MFYILCILALIVCAVICPISIPIAILLIWCDLGKGGKDPID